MFFFKILLLSYGSTLVVHKSSYELQMRDTSNHMTRHHETAGKNRAQDQQSPSGSALIRNQRDTRLVNLNKRKAQGGPKSFSIKKVKPSAKELTLHKHIRETIEPNEAEASKEFPKSKNSKGRWGKRTKITECTQNHWFDFSQRQFFGQKKVVLLWLKAHI